MRIYVLYGALENVLTGSTFSLVVSRERGRRLRMKTKCDWFNFLELASIDSSRLWKELNKAKLTNFLFILVLLFLCFSERIQKIKSNLWMEMIIHGRLHDIVFKTILFENFDFTFWAEFPESENLNQKLFFWLWKIWIFIFS